MSVAVIQANNFPNKSKVFGIPLRRALVLALVKAGVTDIVWEGASLEQIEQTFAGAGGKLCRFHYSTCGAGPGARGGPPQASPPLPTALGPASSPERVLILQESTIFFAPAVLRLLMDWPDEESVEAMHQGNPVGLRSHPLSGGSKPIYLEIPKEDTFFLEEPHDRRRAGKRLFQTIALKPNDGIFARFNKRVMARPLIAFFLRTPLSANAATFSGLGFAIAGAFALSRGGYFAMAIGAWLAYVSALFDHADGVVARLKLQQSEFGCWLESMADYTSYLMTFAALGWGLQRETGNPVWLWLSAAMLGGLVLTFLSFSLQRLQLGQPEELARVIEANLEEKRRNLLTWFGRRCVLFTRRAFLCYVILFFVLLGQAGALLWVGAVGANLAWILNVYYSAAFRRRRAVGHAV